MESPEEQYTGASYRQPKIRLPWLLNWILGDTSVNGWTWGVGPPNNWAMMPWFIADKAKDKEGNDRFKTELSGSFGNHAFEFWVAQKYTEGDHVEEKWVFHCRCPAFRKIALWYLWRWAWGEWFGLRRKLYYWRLMNGKWMR